jgi:anti-anti-sigma regulatory factor
MGASSTFTVHMSSQHNKAGLSLRGSCHSALAAQQLEQAVTELVSTGLSFVWVDCRYLSFLSWHGQRAIFNTHQRARMAGCTVYWCGFAPSVLGQLADTGLHLLLNMLPAGGYQGPTSLLQEAIPAVLRTRPHRVS